MRTHHLLAGPVCCQWCVHILAAYSDRALLSFSLDNVSSPEFITCINPCNHHAPSAALCTVPQAATVFGRGFATLLCTTGAYVTQGLALSLHPSSGCRLQHANVQLTTCRSLSHGSPTDQQVSQIFLSLLTCCQKDIHLLRIYNLLLSLRLRGAVTCNGPACGSMHVCTKHAGVQVSQVFWSILAHRHSWLLPSPLPPPPPYNRHHHQYSHIHSGWCLAWITPVHVLVHPHATQPLPYVASIPSTPSTAASAPAPSYHPSASSCLPSSMFLESYATIDSSTYLRSPLSSLLPLLSSSLGS